MKLSEWLHKEQKTPADIAAAIGVGIRTAYRLASGERRPKCDSTMQKIFILTEGQVTANDFYNIKT